MNRTKIYRLKSDGNNDYLLSQGIPQIVFLHPVFNYLLDQHNCGTDLQTLLANAGESGIEVEEGVIAYKEDLEYYYSFFKLLDANGYFTYDDFRADASPNGCTLGKGLAKSNAMKTAVAAMCNNNLGEYESRIKAGMFKLRAGQTAIKNHLVRPGSLEVIAIAQEEQAPAIVTFALFFFVLHKVLEISFLFFLCFSLFLLLFVQV